MKISRKIRLTKTKIKELPGPPEGSNLKQLYYYDSEVTGLTVSVSRAGRRTYGYHRKVNGKQIRRVFNDCACISLEEAREAATEYNRQLRSGYEPSARKPLTFGELYQHYLDEYARRNVRRIADLEASYRLYFRKRWHSSIVQDIRRADVKAWLPQLVKQVVNSNIRKRTTRETGESTANRCLDTFKAIVNWGIKEEYVTMVNPATRVEKYKTSARERFVRPEELSAFLEAVQAEPNQVIKDFVLMCLYTGQRRSAIQSMRFDEVIEHDWHIPANKQKNGKTQVTPLAPGAMAIIERRKSDNSGPWVFPGRYSGHLEEPKAGFARILKRANLDGLTIHDLRRTVATYLAMGGTSLPLIGGALGHTSQRSTAVYARYTTGSLRNEMSKHVWGRLGASNTGELQPVE